MKHLSLALSVWLVCFGLAAVASDTWQGAVQNPDNPSDVVTDKGFPDKQWWLTFHDTLLNGYIEEALKSNQALAVAEARITESRALARFTMSHEFPTLSLQPSFNRQRNSAHEFPSFGASSSSGSSGGFVLGQPFNLYSLPLEANYETDFFLKKHDQTRSAYKQAEATARDYQTARIALITDVASTYFNLASEDKLINFQKDYIRFAEADLQAERAKMAEGLVSEETVAIKEGILSNAKAALQEYYRLQGMYTNQLAILLGKTPEEARVLPRSDLDQFAIPQVVEAGIPSVLVTQRPDILSAEALLEKSKIDVRVARKEIFPTINLTGQFGFSAAKIAQLLDWQSRVYSLGGSLAQTVFDAGALRANLKVNKARQTEQLHQYQQTILTAFEEVDNALDSLKAHRAAYQNYDDAYASLNKQLSLEQSRLAEGDIAGAELYPTELQIIQAKEGLVGTKILGLTDALNLYKAVGGGY